MNSVTMLQTASILLLITAAGGLLMAFRRVAQKANPPSWLAMAHGFLAPSGLTLLAYACLTARLEDGAMLGLILLAVAAAGGVVMNLAYHLAGKLLPLWLLYLHIALAAAGRCSSLGTLGQYKRSIIHGETDRMPHFLLLST